ncbi:2-hydroxy-palmitic acid dioxygenase mpo1-like [Actinidia eriantha]|uniref:2-hydroxy-palmitic acid dioxygenase mpo1-like n=1 Tax=Actinidia eriantha TaxID=165200 RepID=UPI00258DC5E7|nr:2-hydroxy-palmitic acid dioxygenase mpo1-like [Actinidia eriantha]
MRRTTRSSSLMRVSLDVYIFWRAPIIFVLCCWAHLLHSTSYSVFYTVSVNLTKIEVSLFGDDLSLILNIGFLLTLIYAVFYICFDAKAGSLAAFFCFICWVFSSYLASLIGLSLAWKVVLAAQLVCWTGQFIGHGVSKKRAPALLENLSQTFLMAPFFILLEVLQSFFGYEPYPGFQVAVQAKIDAEISEWQEKKNLIS